MRRIRWLLVGLAVFVTVVWRMSSYVAAVQGRAVPMQLAATWRRAVKSVRSLPSSEARPQRSTGAASKFGAVAPLEIEVLTPDEFLINLYGLDPVLVVHTLHEQGNDLKPMRTIQQILAALQPACPQFVQRVQSELDIENPER